ncbi:quinate/shikimate dehydrogenase [Terribacillus halophilus]|uniref:quinate/shikimate dehydrogenase n=1 Tax=Terribacillus halophilus TaxID=361279 RepID=UPI0009856DC1|nr:quinate/shikimate dehydrogenase [Terribacillus halophilus]
MKDKNLAQINGKTTLIGLLASPIGHSMTPAMHNLGYTISGLNYAYLAFDVGRKDLCASVEGMKALGAAGFNVSMPNKIAILQYLDELDDSARLARASNTVVHQDGKLIGYNTDGLGYVMNLKEQAVPLEGIKVTLVGSGGVAAPIAIQLAQSGIKELSVFARQDSLFANAEDNVSFINREMKAFGVTATVFPFEDKTALRKEISESAILTNATSLGMKPHDESSILDGMLDVLRADLTVSDVVYNPMKTKLLAQAEAAGATAINGLGMVLWQGALAYKLFTGEDMPVEQIREIMFGCK